MLLKNVCVEIKFTVSSNKLFWYILFCKSFHQKTHFNWICLPIKEHIDKKSDIFPSSQKSKGTEHLDVIKFFDHDSYVKNILIKF